MERDMLPGRLVREAHSLMTTHSPHHSVTCSSASRRFSPHGNKSTPSRDLHPVASNLRLVLESTTNDALPLDDQSIGHSFRRT